MIKAVVFDLDDTLFPEKEFVVSGFRSVALWLERERGIGGVFEHLQRLFESGKRGNLFDLALERVGASAAADLVSELVQVYRCHRPTLSLFPDAEQALNCMPAHLKLGILTDGFLQTQRNKVEALGLERRFHTITFSDAFGRENWKPSPVPYLKTAEALGCDGRECVYVADNPAKDFVTAKQLGWGTVQVHRPIGEYCQLTADAQHCAHRTIASLDQLMATLPDLESASMISTP